MQPDYTLTFSISGSARVQRAELALCDASGTHLSYHCAQFHQLRASDMQALFDLRNHLQNYIAPHLQQDEIKRVGVLIAEKVLGEEIFLKLWLPQHPRALRIVLPPAASAEHDLAAALTRIPWEMARPSAARETLSQRNLHLCLSHHTTVPTPTSALLPLVGEAALKILFVFAEARGARPLAMRQERREMLALLWQEVFPKRKVIVDVLTYGLTRSQLQLHLQRHGGYHILHWSGHGARDALELATPQNHADMISGQDLLTIFKQAGVALPHLVFLSACNSGDIATTKNALSPNWQLFFDHEEQRALLPLPERDIEIPEANQFHSVAHTLLDAGVAAIVAMRFTVGDEYARQLAQAFYRALLADAKPKSVALALMLARNTLQSSATPMQFAVCDHATALLYGTDVQHLLAPIARSPQLRVLQKRLPALAELQVSPDFVGRTWQLAALGQYCLAENSITPIAQCTGLAGMGKTSLAAEILQVWEAQFDWLVLFQAKTHALSIENFFADMHLRLLGECGIYQLHLERYPADAIYRPMQAGFDGQARLVRLTQNLLRAMQDEAIFLVLDNFESNLQSLPHADTGAWPCHDSAWDRLLATLAAGLIGSRSRILITSRRPLAAIAQASHLVMLGPLPAPEARLYLRQHPHIRTLAYSNHEHERIIAKRLLQASRFHPLLLHHLGQLCALGAPYEKLQATLNVLERNPSYADLPSVLSSTMESDQPSEADHQRELAYLEQAMASSIDQLLAQMSAPEKKLLWILSLAHEAVSAKILQAVWQGKSWQEEHAIALQHSFSQFADWSPLQQALWRQLDSSEQAKLMAPPSTSHAPESAMPIASLISLGLVSGTESTRADKQASDNEESYFCHEIVRERIAQWAQSQSDFCTLEAKHIWLAFAEHLQVRFSALQTHALAETVGYASRILKYFIAAQDYVRLKSFASYLLNTINEAALLQSLVPLLRQALADSANSSDTLAHCTCSALLADALSAIGEVEGSIAYYAQGAHWLATHDSAHQHWSSWVEILAGWAFALWRVRKVDEAIRQLNRCIAIQQQEARPEIEIISNRLMLLLMQSSVPSEAQELARIESDIEQLLHHLATWWQQFCSGKEVAQVSLPASLARNYLFGLARASEHAEAQGAWHKVEQYMQTSIELQQQLGLPALEQAHSRYQRAHALFRLGQLPLAKEELEACLPISKQDVQLQPAVLTILAGIFACQGDLPQAITQQRRVLVLYQDAPNPANRANAHSNLARYLMKESQSASQHANEASQHSLASMLYRYGAPLFEDLATSLREHGKQRPELAQATVLLAQVTQLLALVQFSALAQWLPERLQQRGESLPQLAQALAMGIAQTSC